MGVTLWHWTPTLTGEVTPHRERQLSPREQGLLRAQVREWLRDGVVEPTPRPVAWTNNLVFVAKKNGDTRVCVDCTPANEVTADLGWPLPRLQDMRHRLGGAQRLTRIDLRNAFFRIRVPAKFRYLTSFRSDGRTYWFVRMPFGLKTAPEVFQRMMDHILARHWNYAYWYIDDILIWGQDRESLRRHTDKVLSTLESNGHVINYTKSVFDEAALLFAGLWLTPTSVGPNFEKLRHLLSLPAPKNKVEAQSALGLASYLRDFIPLTSMLTHRMTGAALNTTEYEEEWGRFVRHVAKSVTTLGHWDENEDSALYTDASLSACAAVLLQHGRIIAMASRKFTPTETRYSTTDREHLGLVLAAEKMRVFLQRTGPITTCHTDHKALLTRRITELTPRQARWRWTIANSITDLRHVRGKDNPADFFSRLGVVDNWGPTFVYINP